MTTTSADLNRLRVALAGDLDGTFPALVAALGDDVFSGALRITGSRSDAEDITQETFTRAYRALAAYPAHRIRELAVRGWIWTIAANLCRNRARSRSRRPAASPLDDSVIADPAPGPEQLAVDAATGDDLAALVAKLPGPQREAVVLRHVVGLGYREIAEAVGRPPGTVKSDVHRGLSALRNALAEEEHR